MGELGEYTSCLGVMMDMKKRRRIVTVRRSRRIDNCCQGRENIWPDVPVEIGSPNLRSPKLTVPLLSASIGDIYCTLIFSLYMAKWSRRKDTSLVLIVWRPGLPFTRGQWTTPELKPASCPRLALAPLLRAQSKLCTAVTRS
jgi:hypothetical protein